jgi:hypothetical protein
MTQRVGIPPGNQSLFLFRPLPDVCGGDGVPLLRVLIAAGSWHRRFWVLSMAGKCQGPSMCWPVRHGIF